LRQPRLLSEIVFGDLRQKRDLETTELSAMARNTSKLRFNELVSDFRCVALEIGIPSNGSFEK